MLSEINKHPKDIVQFDAENHKYFLNHNGHKFGISVTGFVGKLFEKFNQDAYINNILNSKKQNDPNYEYYGMNREEILENWELRKDLGTELHEQIENYYNSIKSESEILGSTEYQFFLNFENDHNIIPFRTEFRIFSTELDLAGSVDFITKNEDGTYNIIDWKRVSNISDSQEVNQYTKYSTKFSNIIDSKFNHYVFQLNVYCYLLETYYDMKIKDMTLVILHPSNDNYIKLNVPRLEEEINLIMNERKRALNSSILKQIKSKC